MENASKALLMAGGILLGVLILALLVTVFTGSKSLSDSYERAKQEEAIQQFNVNFTKYLGQELTIHEVVTICNFADKNKVTVTGGFSGTNADKISEDVASYSTSIKTYKLEINSYSDEGYVNKIKIINSSR